MQLEVVGKVEVDTERTTHVFPDMRDGTYSAINDVSIANSFYIFDQPREDDANIESLSVLVASPD